jgi:PAS domain S-box-containing protein
MPLIRSRILLLDDDPDDRALARAVLEHQMPELTVEEITDAPAFAQACGRRSFDVVILERELRWADGLALLAALKEDWPEVPVILFTRSGSEELVLRSMRLGADDYLVKKPASFVRLPLAVRSALEKVESRRASGAAPLQSLLDRAQVAVFSATAEGRLLNASPGLLQILGIEDLEGAARLDLRPLIAAAAGQGPAEGGAPGATQEVRLRRADGRPIWVEVVGAVVRDAAGTRIDGLVEDVTARKHADEEMAVRSAQLRRANEELLQFASMAAHELQAPVRMMERYTQLLKEDYGGKLGSSGDELADVIVGAARRLHLLIEDLLALSRVESAERQVEKTSAEALLERTLENLQVEIQESGAAVTHSPLPEIEVEPALMVQLLRNLIGNAIKFHGQAPPRVHVAARRGPREWIFSVRDNGLGVDPAEAESIFSIFKRLHPEIPGTGIGLAICRKIVERHGGRIWVESEPGRGSNFLFTLPAPPPDPTLPTLKIAIPPSLRAPSESGGPGR